VNRDQTLVLTGSESGLPLRGEAVVDDRRCAAGGADGRQWPPVASGERRADLALGREASGALAPPVTRCAPTVAPAT
jgi:hypothetical protein